MRVDRNRLRYLALATLAEQVELATAGPPPPSHGVRLALAVLFTMSEGDMRPFVNFWQHMLDDKAAAGTPTAASYCRTSYLMTQLRCVMRAVGVEPTVTSEQLLDDAALKIYPREKRAP